MALLENVTTAPYEREKNYKEIAKTAPFERENYKKMAKTALFERENYQILLRK